MELWTLASDLVWREVSLDPSRPTRDAADIKAIRDKVRRAIVTGSGRWDAAVDAELAAEYVNASDVSNPGALADTQVAGALECLRIGMLVATGRAASIPAAQVGVVRRAFERNEMLLPLLPAASGRRRTREPSGGARMDVVTFRHAFRQGGPTGRGARTLTLSEGTMPLREVPPEEAPVVARLVGLRGEAIPVRARGDGYLRPVFLPGSQVPADLAAFRDAASRGGPWADNPFLAKPSPGRTLLGLDSVAFPRERTHRNDAAAETAAAEACVRRAGGLVVVDGVVYRPAPEPSLHLAGLRSTFELRGYRVAWRMGDVDMMRGGSTFGTDWHGGDLLSDGMPFGTDGIPFGIGDADQVVAVLRACSEEAGEVFPVRFRDVAAVAWHDPGQFPGREYAVLEHVGALCGQGVHGWADIAGLSSATTCGRDDLVDVVGRMSDAAGRWRGSPGDSGIAARAMLKVAIRQAGERLEADLESDGPLAGFAP